MRYTAEQPRSSSNTRAKRPPPRISFPTLPLVQSFSYVSLPTYVSLRTCGAGFVQDLLRIVFPPPQETGNRPFPVMFFRHGVATVDHSVQAPLMLTKLGIAPKLTFTRLKNSSKFMALFYDVISQTTKLFPVAASYSMM